MGSTLAGVAGFETRDLWFWSRHLTVLFYDLRYGIRTTRPVLGRVFVGMVPSSDVGW